MKLATHHLGEKTDQPNLVIAHGLFGSSRNWRAIARQFSKDRLVVTVDMRNHGESFWADTQSYFDMADDLRAVIANLDGPSDLLGHSMGGKAAMVRALRDADTINRLLVVDIAPVPYAHSHQGHIDALQALDLTTLSSRKEADEMLQADIPDEMTRAFLLQSLVMGPDGARWSLNLDVLSDEMDKIIGFPEIEGLFNESALFLRGAASDYVDDKFVPEIKRLFPQAVFDTIAGAGHWIQADKPREFIASIKAYLG
ncbi:MAG: alpha/beta fold hydrolase [Pseudomonadota bacterium]